MKTLITGGAGFIGSHLVDRLIKDGREVICVDNLYTGSKKNIEEFFKNGAFKFVEHDITKPLEFEGDIDEIYNLACPASPVHYQKNPVFTWLTSVYGVKNMLDLALEKNARFLQASTSEVYGDPLEHPQKESYWGNINPIGVRACYDEGKRAAETICFDYRRTKNLDVKVARIFNTYGPKMARDDGRVVSNFIVQALEARDITIFGDGTQTRSFCYVDDMVEGLIKIMASNESGPINLGNPGEYKILELAQEIIKLTGSKSKIVYKSLPEDDPVRRKPDISRAKKMLGWEPRVPLEEGLRKTIEYFRKL